MSSGRPVAFVEGTLGAGGAERALTLIASGLAAAGLPVHLVLLDAPDRPIFYPLAADVGVTRLDLMRDPKGPADALAANLRRIRRVRHTLARIDARVVISFLPEPSVIAAAAAFPRRRLILSERSSTVDVVLQPPWRQLRRLALARADAIVYQTERARAAVAPTLQRKGVVIPNPLNRRIEAAADVAASRNFVAVGRFVPEKGFDRLIQAFAMIAAGLPGWTLTIWGDGPERPALAALVARLDLAGRVAMPGISPTALGWIGDGSIFVLSSRFEGFPNALCEAMLAGYAVVATDCRFGPREIITDGRDGLLVADEAPAPPAALARAMQRLAEDPALRQGLAAAARASAARFDLAAVIPAWTALVHRLGGP